MHNIGEYLLWIKLYVYRPPAFFSSSLMTFWAKRSYIISFSCIRLYFPAGIAPPQYRASSTAVPEASTPRSATISNGAWFNFSPIFLIAQCTNRILGFPGIVLFLPLWVHPPTCLHSTYLIYCWVSFLWHVVWINCSPLYFICAFTAIVLMKPFKFSFRVDLCCSKISTICFCTCQCNVSRKLCNELSIIREPEYF